MSAARRRPWTLTPLLLVVIVAGCGGDPGPPFSPYVGVWEQRGARAVSQIAIAHDGEKYRFRWTKNTDDNNYTVRCNWDGDCEEYDHGKLNVRYKFDIWVDEVSGNVVVECRGEGVQTDITVQYKDELVVDEGGELLWAYALEVNGKQPDPDNRPKRKYTRVSVEIEDPPRRVKRS